MAAYIILDANIHDAAGYDAYRAAGSPSVAQYGGRYIVRGGAVTSLEGGWRPGRLVVIEFPSVEQAQRWYRSPEYQAALPLRLRAATSSMLVVEGATTRRGEP